MSYNVHYQNIITFFKKNQKSCQNNLLTSISAPHCERNVGILVIDVYTTSMFVPHGKLKEYSVVSKGKYTIW